MTEITFDDLIPSGEPKSAAGPFQVTSPGKPPKSAAAPGDISFDDLLPTREMGGRERAYREGRKEELVSYVGYDTKTKAILTELGNLPERWTKEYQGIQLQDAERAAAVDASDIGTEKRLGSAAEAAAASSADMKTRLDAMPRRDPRRRQLEAEYLRLKEEEGVSALAAGDTEANIASERAAFAQDTKASHQAMTGINEAVAGMEKSNPRPGFDTTVVNGIAAVGDMAPGFVSSFLTKSPLPLMAFIAAKTKGGTYADLRTEGVGREEADTASSLYAAAEAIPEALPLHVLLSGGTGWLTKVVGGAMTERVSEMLTEGLQILVDKGYLDKNITMAEANDRIREAGDVGGFMGVVMGAGAAGYDAAASYRDREAKKGTPADPNANPPLPTTPPVATQGDVPADVAAAAAKTAPSTGSAPAAGDTVSPEVAAALAPKTAASVARDKLKAMRGAATTPEAPVDPATAPETAQEAPVAPTAAPTTPEAATAAPGAAPEATEPMTVPESPDTIEAQRDALRAGRKVAVLYPTGSVLPEEMGGRIKRISINGAGVFDYDSKQISAATLRGLARLGRLNEVLELGNYDKGQVAASTAAGSEPTAVVERTPDGTEVKAAAGTEEMAADQVASLEATKLAPENTVTVENPNQVIEERAAAAAAPATFVAPQAADGSSPVRKIELSEEEKQELVRKYDLGRSQATAAPAAGVAPTAASEAASAPAARSTAARKPAKAAAAIAKSKAKESPAAEVTPQGNLTEREQRIVDAITKADKNIAAEKRRAAQTNAQAKARSDKLEAKKEDVARANRGEIDDAEGEARTRRTEDTKDRKREAAAVQNAVKAKALQDQAAPKVPENFKTITDAARIYNRMKDILRQAKDRGITIPARIQDQHTNAQAWLASIRTMATKLARMEGNISPEAQREILSDLAAFLGDEYVYLFTGDATGMRENRKEAGAQVAGRSGELKEEAVAAEEKDDAEEGGASTEDEPLTPDEPDDAGMSDLTAEEVTKAAPLPDAEVEPDAITAGADKAGTFKVEAKKAPKKLIGAKGAAAVRKSQARSAPTKSMASRALGHKPKTLAGGERTDLKAGWLIRGKTVAEKVRNYLKDWWKTYGGTYAPGSERSEIYVDLGHANADGAGLPDVLELALAVRTERLGDILDQSEAELRDKLLVALSERGGTIFTGALATFQAAVAEHINSVMKKLVGSVRVLVLKNEDFDMLNPVANAYYTYSMVEDMIVVPERLFDDPTKAAFVLLHEAMHAAVAHYLEGNKALEQKINELIEYVTAVAIQNNWDLDFYFTTNAHEFLSEAISNPEIQEFLSRVPLTPDMAAYFAPPLKTKGAIRTALDAVRSAAWKIFKLDEWFAGASLVKPPTAFDAAVDIMDFMFTRSTTSRIKTFGNVSGERFTYSSRTSRTKPSVIEGKLRKLGLNRAQAKEINDLIRDEFGNKATDAELRALADAVLAELPKEANKSKKKLTSAFDNTVHGIRRQAEKAGADALQQLNGDFVPGKNPGRPRLLSLATNYQIGEIADRFFGKMSNPVRVIAAWLERRRVTKARYMKELSPVLEKLRAAEKKHKPEVWNEFLSLAQASTLANVHPDRPLSANTHLGKDALAGMWGKARHAGLEARFNALPGDLQQLYKETRDTLTDTQNRMTLAVVRNLLRKAGYAEGADGEALAQRFHEGKATAADYRLVGEELAAHIEAADQLRKIEGPYFNLVRRGNFVVRGTYKIEPPTKADFPSGKQLEPNLFEFTDRKEAVTYAGKQELRTTIDKVWVDKATGKKFVIDDDGTEVRVSQHDANAEARYLVRVQDEYVEFVDTRKEAIRAAEQLRKDGLKVKDVEPKRYERDAQNAEMLSDQMLSIMKTLDKRSATSKLSAAQRGEMVGALNEISLRFLGSTRIQSARLPRRGVAGASTDMVRNTFDYIDSASGYLAKLDTAPTLEDALVELERRVSDISSRGTGSGEGARMISNEIEKRVYARIPGEDDGSLNNGVNRATSLAFLYNLASPAYSLINATQVAMVSLPQLSGDFNPMSAMLQLLRAYKDIGAAGITAGGLADTVRAVSGKMVTADRFIDNIKRNLSAGEKAMIDELADEGLIDADGGLEIARVIDRNKDGFWAKADSAIYYLDNIARAMPSAIEAINRSVTAIAAYRMAMKKFKDPARALQYAKDMVNDTQALMSNSNAAPIFSNPAGRIALQFKKFGQMTYYLLGKNIGRVLRPQAAGERFKGALALAYMLAAHQIVAGTAGLPWEPARLAMMAFNGLGLTDLSWDEFEEMIAAFYADLLGEDDDDEDGVTKSKGAEMLTFGISRGIPGGWGFDLSSRIGLDSLAVFGEPRSGAEQDVKAYLVDFFTGPVGRLVDNSFTAVSDMIEGDFSKAPGMLIPFKALSDSAKALRGGARGEMTTPDMVLRAIGLTSARQANISREIGANIRASTDRSAALKEITKIYTSARTKAEIARAVSKLRDYNNSLPKGDRNRRSVESMEKMRLENLKVYENN